MVFWKSEKAPATNKGNGALDELVRAHLEDADDDTRALVVALAGLLATVAYADRQYSDVELTRTREALAGVHGLSAQGADAICAVLREQVTSIATINTQAFTRSLRERGDIGLRREVLGVLVDLAAADGELTLAETDLLRRTAAAMGLSPDDYVAAQAHHRDKLRALR